MMRVPFSDLAAVNHLIGWRLKDAYNRVLERGHFVLGEEVTRFETSWAEYCQKQFCIGVASGLDALTILLGAHSVGDGDEVIVPAHTCIATWIAVSAVGATPVPVDVDPDTYNIDARLVERAMSPKTRAVIAVHLYGRPADVDNLRTVTDVYKVPLLIDAAQAHGIKGFELGRSAAFSFYPTKNLGALGDGGAIVTDDEEVAEYARRARNYGSVVKDKFEFIGMNSRLDELQAAFLSAKLSYLDEMNSLRRRNAMLYGAKSRAVFHQYVTQCENRAAVRNILKEQGIDSMVHYPIPPYLQPAYQYLGYEAKSFPVASHIAETILSLPVGPELTEAQVKHVKDVFLNAEEIV